MYITILTPTYNRGENLKKLYKSLLKQKDNRFEWLIVDDGSTDGTKKIIDEFLMDSKINIKYLYKKNGGKHTALNLGIKEINTDLIFIVDSDDYLNDNAIQSINEVHEKYKKREDICGYSFLRMVPNNKINGKMLDANEVIDDYINVRIKGDDMDSDKAEVWKTRCLKEYQFPEFDGEKFLGEDVVWLQLALKYKMVFFNKAIYVSEYLNDGLTKNRRINNINSPLGCYNRAKIALKVCQYRNVRGKYLIKAMMQYQIYARFSKYSLKKIYKECNQKILFVLAFLPSQCVYRKWRKKYVN